MKLKHQITDEKGVAVSYAFGDLSLVAGHEPTVLLDYDSLPRCAPILVTESGQLIMRPASRNYGIFDRHPRGRARIEIPSNHLWQRFKIDLASATLDMSSSRVAPDAVHVSAVSSELTLHVGSSTRRVEITGTSTSARIQLDGELSDGLRISGVGLNVTIFTPDHVNVSVQESGLANNVTGNRESGRGVRVELVGLRNNLCLCKENGRA